MFYSDFVIDNEVLKQDTFLLREKERRDFLLNDSIKNLLQGEISDLKNAIAKDTTIRNNYKKSYSNCSNEKAKVKKWNKFWKNVVVTLTAVAIIETSIIIITIKK